jgi:acetyl esterase/lipase
MIVYQDIEYKENLCLDLYLPENDTFDLFVYFHGGGLVSGSRKGVENFSKTLAKNNIATASVEYRMYPNAKFPDFIRDCAYSIRWLKDNIKDYGKCNKIFVGGSSAGGYLSMMLCFDERYLKEVGMSPTDIAGYIHDAGQPTAHFNVLKELGKDSRRLIVDETAPMYFVGLQEKYSPMLFIVSDEDMFARYEQTILMIKTLEHFGHKDNVYLRVLHGKHCEHTYKVDENGEGILGCIINDFVDTLN